MPFQSVLVILVPEAEALVGPFRSRYDSSAANGMPAHITINCPFLPGEKDKSAAIGALKNLFSGYQSFRYSLISVKRFPGVIYLEPFPGKPFADLIQAVIHQFPQSPPYGGMFGDVPPHLTVAVADDKEALEEINRQFAVACIRKLPIHATAGQVWLMDNKQGLWTRRHSFALAKHL
jgi:2'-5' RNA ligase